MSIDGGAGRHAGGCDDADDLVDLGLEFGEFGEGERFGLDAEVQPEGTLVGFFFDNAEFGNELRLGSSSACRAVIGGDRSGASRKLPGDGSSRDGARQRLRDLQTAKGEPLCPLFEFIRCHSVLSGNRQSQSVNRQ